MPSPPVSPAGQQTPLLFTSPLGQHMLPEHVRPEAQVPHSIVWPQLFTRLPQVSVEPHDVKSGTHGQYPSEPHAAPPAHVPQSTKVPHPAACSPHIGEPWELETQTFVFAMQTISIGTMV
jgi:hypothetical protein